ncbi:MAG: RNA methyltransferase [Vicinamibacterales bacterium]
MPDPPRLTSRQHPAVKRCRRIARRREPDDPVLLDGEHLVLEAHRAGVPLDLVLTAGPAHGPVAAAARAAAEAWEVSAAALEAASPVRSPSGIVALARWRPAPLEAVLGRPGLIVGLVDVQDPGNLGAVIRSAHALGAAGVVALDATADPGGWRALRGAMGSTFHLPVARGGRTEALALAARAGAAVTATAIAGGTPLAGHAFGARTLLLLGHEGAGLPPDVLAAASGRLTIPMRPGVDSLNVAVTASLVLYEATRAHGVSR